MSLMGRGTAEDFRGGAELDANLAPWPMCCVTLDKPITFLGFGLLFSPTGKRLQERGGPNKP